MGRGSLEFRLYGAFLFLLFFDGFGFIGFRFWCRDRGGWHFHGGRRASQNELLLHGKFFFRQHAFISQGGDTLKSRQGIVSCTAFGYGCGCAGKFFDCRCRCLCMASIQGAYLYDIPRQ